MITTSTRMVGVRQFRQNLTKLTERARLKKERLVVLRKNIPIFEILPIAKVVDKDTSFQIASGKDILKELGPISQSDYAYYENL
ncbi:MAG TPA: hypothetical protein VJI73_01060 [Candidatus Paceibacterota bacterium]